MALFELLSDNADDFSRFFLQVVIPKPEDGPALTAQAIGHLFVALAIFFNLWLPVFHPGFGEPFEPRRAMPKGAVNKEGDPLREEDKIGFSQQAVGSYLPSPYAALNQVGAKPQFRRFVAGGADAGHDAGARLF